MHRVISFALYIVQLHLLFIKLNGHGNGGGVFVPDLCVSFFRITTVVPVTRDLETIATGVRTTAAARVSRQLGTTVFQKCLANSGVYWASCLANLPRHCHNLAIVASGYNEHTKSTYISPITTKLTVANQPLCEL